MKCKCGRPATHTCWVPQNVWARLRQFKKPYPICTYHVEKAKKDFEVTEGVQAGDMQLR